MTNVLTPPEVADLIGLSVSSADIALAQSVIEVESGTDLGSVGLEDRYAEADVAKLRQAVLWQVHYLNTDAGKEALTRAADVSRVATNGASVDFSGSVDGILAPLAAKALSRLSWRAGPVKVTSLKPTRTLYGAVQPDPWVRIN